ncbi:hypothetical protein ACULLZ_17515 [Xanthomonas arboricola pv. corylina]|uniref:hypothetical protein n=1 Tax=Xanthomonas arboricola TaxID=56448 RepID=UPI004040C222
MYGSCAASMVVPGIGVAVTSMRSSQVTCGASAATASALLASKALAQAPASA